MVANGRSGRYVALLGDLVGSRRVKDRAGLHARVTEALAQVNATLDTIQPLTLTVGDEFQGLFADVPTGIDATLLLSLHLSEVTEVRFGIGWGRVEVFQEDALPFQQDGPAWWAAREALGEVEGSRKQRKMPRSRRTAFGPADVESADLVNAYLLCRDSILERFDDLDARIVLGLLAGDAQDVIARREGVTQSAIAQRIGRNDAYALLQARDRLKRGT